MLRKSDAHNECGERLWSVQTKKLEGDNEGCVSRLKACKLEWFQEAKWSKPAFREVPGSDFCLEVDLVILAMGFLGPEETLPSQAGLHKTPRGAITGDSWGMTNQDGVFVAGDAHRGASLVVWAIWEGREAAKGINRYLKRRTKDQLALNPTV
jgi:glutamate synthase (NADPH/NADH) small chain